MFEGIIGCCPSDKLCRQVMLLCCIVCLLNVKIFFVLENQSEKTMLDFGPKGQEN